ncbi:hypothetical protein GCM10007385_15260 [Tateyamaria omphalii]|uniref:DUF1223 domain-containing protein n=1 Tax=Tateyamaria omphalii TaxID=299262 RepID=UPI001679C849|nr:DUF1223 domain-containing protein [Tateyamaria omphalii]GGX48333.1 hypothetical protein GCM10007385_15260 [Tateyamaria omphalii]
MHRLIPLAFAAFASLVNPASAQSPVVVELFTSQGCSSCPPADKLMHELAKRDDVIALALHVDYWDYIGWKDEFADPAYAKRQRGYAVQAGRRSVYTPQMIINGQTDIVGARPMELSRVISDYAGKATPVTLEVTRSGDRVQIVAQSSEANGPLVVQMLRYTPERTARITRGENAGHTISYANVTEDWKILQEWDGITDLAIEADAPGEKPLVVMVQKGLNGPILAASQLR